MEVIGTTIILAVVFIGVLFWALTPPETEEQRRQREHDEYYQRYF